jgi:hypothetical protein
LRNRKGVEGTITGNPTGTKATVFYHNQMRGDGISEEKNMMLTRKVLGLCMKIRVKGHSRR